MVSSELIYEIIMVKQNKAEQPLTKQSKLSFGI